MKKNLTGFENLSGLILVKNDSRVNFDREIATTKNDDFPCLKIFFNLKGIKQCINRDMTCPMRCRIKYVAIFPTQCP
jgi:hypothetical protein